MPDLERQASPLVRSRMRPRRAVAGHLFGKFVRVPAPEPFTDRRGRLHGNLRALRDPAREVLQSERVVEP